MIHRSMESDGYESCERNRYSDDDAGSGSYGDGDDGVEDYDFNDGDASDDDVREKAYTILSEADIQQLQEEDISRLSNELYIPRAHSCILLCHYNWNSGKVHDEWFSDEGKVRNVVGLLEHPAVMPNVQELSCRICLELYRCSEMRAASCGHLFCHECWRGYIHSSINDGPGCLMLRCPSPSCAASVGQDMVNDFVSDEDKEKYSRYLRRFYIENDRKTKWCPAPGCEFAVNFDRSSSNCDVCCGCAYSFCWNCEEEGHRPVDCETVAKWIFKNSSEAENTKWILANSKPCPKCKRPIEKNQGCMHMTCNAPCRFEFCWLCLGAWSEHGEMTGGFYACNGYEKAKQEGTIYEEENRRQIAKNSLERYTHYYERWASNQSSRQKALADLQSMRTEKFEKLHENLSVPETEFGFIIEAWEQIVDCRRVLKWTYAFGYYLPESEKEKRQLFEYLQGEAESGLERLHMCAEKELKVFLSEEDPSGTSKEFSDYRRKLAGLTRVTQSYFENLVQALESGLVEVGASSMI